ncbi:MAG TPA: hypothetical protein PKJ55_11550 [Novosphingobium sp.]|nr:hypothetical protein [Novosphingobium sp.]HQD99603.1 hypothetical protein [Novosphingobium sp.]
MTSSPRRAIIDIGSNSIRLVVYGGPRNAPVPLYDDKITASLGRGVVLDGRIDAESMALALKALRRFAALLRLLDGAKVRVVATAAVRDAANGAEFLAAVRGLGLPVELLSGEDEARASAWGVIAAHPGARGIVADLGGGSLELALIDQGGVGNCVSLPLGVMRVAGIRAGGRGRLRKALREALTPLDWLGQARGQRLYLVGGAWRALDRARAHIDRAPALIPVPAEEARALKGRVRARGPARLAAIPGVSAARAAQLAHASALLSALVAELGPADVEVSGAGLREGLLVTPGKFST